MKPPPPVNGDFVSEGTFLALPPCFPGVSVSVEAAASRIHRLCLSPSGKFVYAATRGPDAHLIQFAPKGSFGYAVDLGCPCEEAEIIAVTARSGGEADELLTAMATPEGTRVVQMRAALLGHGIQEWHVVKSDIRLHWEFPEFWGRDLMLSPDGKKAALIGGGKCLLLTWSENSLKIVREMVVSESIGRLFGRTINGFSWVDRIGCVWALDWEGKALRVLFSAENQLPALVSPSDLGAVWVDGGGRVWEWLSDSREVLDRGWVSASPVQALCRLPDGRIYAFAGEGLSHWYVLEKGGDWARDLGVAVSTLSSRRYGFQFGDLLAGADGEIYAAENDFGGHLWIYFPPLLSA